MSPLYYNFIPQSKISFKLIGINEEESKHNLKRDEHSLSFFSIRWNKYLNKFVEQVFFIK